MDVNSLPKTASRLPLEPGSSAPESSTLTTRLPSRPLHAVVGEKNNYKQFRTQKNMVYELIINVLTLTLEIDFKT